MRISKEYKATLIEQHKSHPLWGATALLHEGRVQSLVNDNFCFNALDYGCGKGVLKKMVGKVRWFEYDPGIEGKDFIPKVQYDLVTCIDVMEHIEPEFVDDVLKEVIDLGNKVVFLVISLRPAVGVLVDGRNAHLSVHDHNFWMDKIRKLTEGYNFRVAKDELIVTINKWNHH